MNWKNKYCQNVNTTQSYLHSQCNPYQNSSSILHRARTNNPKICMELEKIPNSQSNPEKENQSWRHHNPGLQPVLQSCTHQGSMVLAQKQTNRSMEQNRKLRGAGVAQLVGCPTSAQVMISRFVSLSPAPGSVLTAQSLMPVSDSVSPSLSAPPLLMLSLCPSKRNKH